MIEIKAWPTMSIIGIMDILCLFFCHCNKDDLLNPPAD